MATAETGWGAPVSIRTAAMWSASSQYLGFAIQFVAGVVIARYFLGPAEVGLFSFAFSVAALVHGLQDFGLTRYVIGAPEIDDAHVRRAFSVSILVALFIAGTVMLVARPVAAFYGEPMLWPMLSVIGASFLFIPFSVVPLALMQRRMDFRGCALVDLAANTSNFAVSLFAAWQGYSSLSLAFGVLGYQLVRAVATQALNPIFKAWPPQLRGTGSIIGYGMSASVLSLTGTVGARAPELIVGKLIGSLALGLYGRATGLALQIRLLVGGPLAAVFYPSLARARDRGEDVGEHYVRLTGALCAVAWPAMAGLAVASQPLILAVYGERWAETAPILAWVAGSQIFFIAIPMQIEVAYLFGSFHRVIVLTILDALLSIVLLLAAARYGLVAVAMSRIVHGVIWWTVHAIYIQRLVRFSWRSMLGVYAKTAVSAVAAVVPLLAAYALWVGPTEMPFALLLSLSACGAGCWYVALCLVRHPSAADLTDLLRVQLARFGRRSSQA